MVKDIGIESDSEGQCIGVQKGNEDFVAYLNEKIAEKVAEKKAAAAQAQAEAAAKESEEQAEGEEAPAEA